MTPDLCVAGVLRVPVPQLPRLQQGDRRGGGGGGGGQDGRGDGRHPAGGDWAEADLRHHVILSLENMSSKVEIQ